MSRIAAFLTAWVSSDILFRAIADKCRINVSLSLKDSLYDVVMYTLFQTRPRQAELSADVVCWRLACFLCSMQCRNNRDVPQ